LFIARIGPERCDVPLIDLDYGTSIHTAVSHGIGEQDTQGPSGQVGGAAFGRDHLLRKCDGALRLHRIVSGVSFVQPEHALSFGTSRHFADLALLHPAVPISFFDREASLSDAAQHKIGVKLESRQMPSTRQTEQPLDHPCTTV
jgi:hypothetical protein